MFLPQKPRCLVVGAGGTGSEIIKILYNLGYSITIIDYDSIETSNLSRQFYFIEKENYCFKSQIIAQKIGCDYKISKIEAIETSYLNNFDVIFSCLDNIPARMELNYKYRNSSCPLMLDCGVEHTEFHIKRVSKNDACLYCIRNLYKTANTPYICSLKNIPYRITDENRDKVLNSLIVKYKESDNEDSHTNIEGIDNKEKIDWRFDTKYNKIVDAFNCMASDKMKTSVFEVKGLYEKILANVCTINSICASYTVNMAFDQTSYDFIYYNGANENSVHKIQLDRDEKCFICK